MCFRKTHPPCSTPPMGAAQEAHCMHMAAAGAPRLDLAAESKDAPGGDMLALHHHLAAGIVSLQHLVVGAGVQVAEDLHGSATGAGAVGAGGGGAKPQQGAVGRAAYTAGTAGAGSTFSFSGCVIRLNTSPGGRAITVEASICSREPTGRWRRRPAKRVLPPYRPQPAASLQCAATTSWAAPQPQPRPRVSWAAGLPSGAAGLLASLLSHPRHPLRLDTE